MAGAGVRGHADPVFLLMHAGVHGHRDAPSLPATPIPTLRTGVQGWTPLPTPQCMQEEAKQLLKANTLEARFLRALQLERQHTTRHFLLPPLPPKDPRPPSLSLCAKPVPWGGVGGGMTHWDMSVLQSHLHCDGRAWGLQLRALQLGGLQTEPPVAHCWGGVGGEGWGRGALCGPFGAVFADKQDSSRAADSAQPFLSSAAVGGFPGPHPLPKEVGPIYIRPDLGHSDYGCGGGVVGVRGCSGRSEGGERSLGAVGGAGGSEPLPCCSIGAE